MDDIVEYKPANFQCVMRIAQHHEVPTNILLAIASVEGGKNGIAMRNTNGTYDLGHMQINTSTYDKEIKKYGISREELQWNGCKNVDIAAYLIKKRISERSKQDFWTKVANYHSRTPFFNAIYKDKVQRYAHEWAVWLKQQYPIAQVQYK